MSWLGRPTSTPISSTSGCMLAHRISSAPSALMPSAYSRSSQKAAIGGTCGPSPTPFRRGAQLARARWRRSSRGLPLASAPATSAKCRAALKLPASKNTLAERSLSETQVLRLLASSPTTATRPSCACCTWLGCASRRSSGSDGVNEAGQVMSSVRAARRGCITALGLARPGRPGRGPPSTPRLRSPRFAASWLIAPTRSIVARLSAWCRRPSGTCQRFDQTSTRPDVSVYR